MIREVVSDIKIEYFKPSEIEPYLHNPRKNDEAVGKVARSIQDFGFTTPILLDEKMIIIAGHTRWKAAKKLKMKKVPCVICRGLSQKGTLELRIADNKTGEFSDWDFALLKDEFEKLDDGGDLESTGYANKEIEDIMTLYGDEYAVGKLKGKKNKEGSMYMIELKITDRDYTDMVFDVEELIRRFPNVEMKVTCLNNA